MKKYYLWLIVILFIALAVRLFNLTYHSLWFDEAMSVYWARQSVPRILEVGFTLVEDRLPPLYYLLLKGWTAVFGFSETSVRLPSVFFGLLLVPATIRIAALLFNRQVALFAGLLAGLNPFLIWYAQEARMYAPAALFSTLMVWAFLEMTGAGSHRQVDPPARPIPLYASLFTLFTVAGLYSHLYTGFLLPALVVWLFVSYPHARRLWPALGLSLLVAALFYLPIALAIWRFSGEALPGHPFDGFGRRVWWLLQAFTVWKAPLSPALQTAVPLIFILFVLAAYVNYPGKNHQPHQGRSPHPLLLVTLLFLMPFLIATLLLFRNHLAFFGERYFIVMVPWLLLPAALGADKLGKFTQRITLRSTQYAVLMSHIPFLLLLTTTVIPLSGQWSIPAAKEAWRQSVAFLAGQAAPNHAILIHPDWVRYPFQYYFEGPGQTYAAFSNVTPETALDGPLQGVVGDHPVIWLVQSHLDSPDPDRLVEQWLAERYPLVTALYPPGLTLKAYAAAYRLKTLPPEATPVDIQFENGLHLIGYQADPRVTATDALFHPPSGWLHVTLYWTASRPVSAPVTPYVQLIGPEGVWGKSLARANDVITLYPPALWLPEQIIRHDLDVNLNPATPPGTYYLVIGLEGEETHYRLGQVQVR